jgi:hypothetical protein
VRTIYPCNSKVPDSQAYHNNNNALTCFMLCDFSLGISEVAVNAQTRQSGTLLAHGRVTAAKDGARPSTVRQLRSLGCQTVFGCCDPTVCEKLLDRRSKQFTVLSHMGIQWELQLC